MEFLKPVIRFVYTPYSIYLSGLIGLGGWDLGFIDFFRFFAQRSAGFRI